MLLNKRRVVIAGAATAGVSLAVVLAATRDLAWIGGVIGGLIVGVRAEDHIDALSNGTAAGALGGLLLVLLIFATSTVSVLSVLRPLNALHYGTAAALPGLLLYPFLFAMEAVVLAIVSGTVLRRAPINTTLGL